MKTKLQKSPAVLFCVLLAYFLISSPEKAAECALSGLEMCLTRLIPSLFPFFVLSAFLTGIGAARTLSRLFSSVFQFVFGVSGKGALPLILGFMGGYPTGVKTLCSQYEKGEISKDEASRLLLFCGNTGPAFILGAAGMGVFASPKAGFILYGTHILAAVIVGIFCRIAFGKVAESPKKYSEASRKSVSQVFTSSVMDSAAACINVTAFVMLFCVLSGLLDTLGATSALCAFFARLGADPVKTKTVITGILELSSGIEALKDHAVNVGFAMPAAAFMLAFGGVSVHCQSLSFIAPTGLKARGYLTAKVFHGLLAAALTCLWVRNTSEFPVFAFVGHASTKAFIFDYMGLFFSMACGIAALVFHLVIRRRLRLKGHK